MRGGEEEYNEGVPLWTLAALPFHHLLKEREREAEETQEEEAAKLREHRWRGAAGSDFVN